MAPAGGDRAHPGHTTSAVDELGVCGWYEGATPHAPRLFTPPTPITALPYVSGVQLGQAGVQEAEVVHGIRGVRRSCWVSLDHF